MTEKEEEKIIDVGNEDFIDSDEWKDNFLKQGKWLRLVFMVVFSFVYYAAMTILWIIVLLQFLFVLFTDKRSENVSKIAIGFRNYMVQILDYLNYETGEKPFPFSDFPKSSEEEK